MSWDKSSLRLLYCFPPLHSQRRKGGRKACSQIKYTMSDWNLNSDCIYLDSLRTHCPTVCMGARKGMNLNGSSPQNDRSKTSLLCAEDGEKILYSSNVLSLSPSFYPLLSNLNNFSVLLQNQYVNTMAVPRLPCWILYIYSSADVAFIAGFPYYFVHHQFSSFRHVQHLLQDHHSF